MFLKIFLKIEARLVLKMFLNFGQIWASRSYKLGSYKKKRVQYSTTNLSRPSHPSCAGPLPFLREYIAVFRESILIFASSILRMSVTILEQIRHPFHANL